MCHWFHSFYFDAVLYHVLCSPTVLPLLLRKESNPITAATVDLVFDMMINDPPRQTILKTIKKIQQTNLCPFSPNTDGKLNSNMAVICIENWYYIVSHLFRF